MAHHRTGSRAVSDVAPVESWRRTLDDVCRDHTKQVIAAVNGNLTEAAKILGIDRRTLARKGYRKRTRA